MFSWEGALQTAHSEMEVRAGEHGLMVECLSSMHQTQVQIPELQRKEL